MERFASGLDEDSRDREAAQIMENEQNIAQLTPEFLALKFFRQDGLSATQISEAIALADYNIAIANLYAVMGTALERNRIELSLVDVVPSN